MVDSLRGKARSGHIGRVRRLDVILLGSLAVALVLYFWTGLATVFFPYDWGYGEGPIIDQAQRIADGETLYKADLDDPPYVIANYPPLYPLLVAAGESATSLGFLQVGRVISLVSALVSALIVGLFASRLTSSHLSGALAGVLFLINPFVLHWSRMARVDLLGLALSLVGLWLLYRRSRSWLAIGAAVLCMLAAIYTRQTFALAAPLAGAVWLWHKSRRRAVAFVVALAGAASLLFLLLNALSGGGFYLNIVAANVNPYLVLRTLSMLALLLGFCPVVVTLAGFEIVKTWRRRTESNGAPGGPGDQREFVLYGLLPYTLGAGVTALTIGKIGSHVNYFVELMAALAVWTALAVGRVPLGRARRDLVQRVLLLCQMGWLLGVGFAVQASTMDRWDDLAAYDRLFGEVRAATAQGPVLADDLMGMVVLAGQRLYLQPFEYQQLNLAGMWDPSPLVQDIQQHRFPLVLLSQPGSAIYAERWAPPVSTALEEHYVSTSQVGDVAVYRPR